MQVFKKWSNQNIRFQQIIIIGGGWVELRNRKRFILSLKKQEKHGHNEDSTGT